jgi:hypothetical protein
MMPSEVNVFLTKAALLDPRMKRVDAREQADMAAAWAEVLDDVSMVSALSALRSHYRSSSDTITPARVIEMVVLDTKPVLPDITAELLEEDRRQQIAAAGVTEAEYLAHQNDRAWLLAKFAPRELEVDHE